MDGLLARTEQIDYELEEPSDEERASSSEDELDVLLNGTAGQKRRLIREYLTGESESSSADEFEKEMEAELSTTLKTLEGTWGPLATVASSAEPGSQPALPETKMYDKIYFDSDSDDEDTPSSSTGRRRRQRCIPTNEELFYDPEEDDRDQAWVDARRRAYSRRPGSVRSRSGPGLPGLPSSDAVLNCPACMTTLCLDCQRHEKYRTQYRAMFVMNCTVKREEVLRYKTLQERKRKTKRRNRKTKEQKVEVPGGGAEEEEVPGPRGMAGEEEVPGPRGMAGEEEVPGPRGMAGEEEVPGPRGMAGEEVYHPVQCTECSTEVAVVDKDEVFHFFNILASHC
ncbi:unnamed protein product [Merluccius merluccius]